MYSIDMNQIIAIKMSDMKPHRVRAVDFIPIHPAADPATVLASEFSSRPHSLAPDTITTATMPPGHVGPARRYPDAEHWATANDAERAQLDNKKPLTGSLQTLSQKT